MTQGEIEKLTLGTEKIFSNLEMRIMEDIVRLIQKNGFSTASSDWQITRLQQLGKSEEYIKTCIQEALDASDEEMEHIFSDEVYKEWYGHDRAYKINGMEQIPLEENEQLQSLIKAVKEQTGDTFQNITGSMGFVKKDPATGKLVDCPLREFYTETLDNAMMDIQTGAFSYQTVLYRTINTMTQSGVRWIDYSTGYRSRVDVAVRRAVMTGFRQVQGKINEQVAHALKTDTYEVTYHVGARPEHQVWQGRVWTMQQLQDICGLGSVTGLHGANCYHDYNAFIPGVSVRTYTDDQLASMMAEENTPKEYNGKQYTTYEALQKQREMERAMRKYRQDVKLMKGGGSTEEAITLKKARYQGKMQIYKDFSKKMKLPEQMGRVYQDGLAIDMRVKVEKASASGIINLSRKEQHAINQYLSFESYGINQKLRDGMVLTDTEQQMVDGLDSALKKIPKFSGNLSRSLYFGRKDETEAFVADIKPGNEITTKEYISTKCTEGLYNPEGEVQIFIQNTKNGRNLSSINTQEAEVLYERNAKFKVLNIQQHEGKYYILLEESK